MTHIYLTRSDVKLGFSQGQLVVKESSGEAERRIPFCNVDSLNVFGNPQISTQLVRECLSSRVPIGYYSEDGHYYGRALCVDHIDPFRQRKQVLLSCNREFCLEWAKRVVLAKLTNSLAFLGSTSEIYSFSDGETVGIAHSIESVQQASTVDEVMGFEGNAAKAYFRCYSKLFCETDFSFEGRNSRPPKDPINAMLSYGYSFLHRSIVGAIERHGLHPYFGFMHKIKHGHAALASDLVEDCRAFLVDKVVVDLARSAEICSKDFTSSENGAVYMSRLAMEKITDSLTATTTERASYFRSYGDNYQYGFHAALDKKINTVVAAIDAANVALFEPFLWDCLDG